MIPNQTSGSSKQAFTLVELLVAIFIITVLIALLVPMVLRAYRQSGVLRTQADFQTIATAIEAYKQDHHGDIPRLPVDPNTGLPYPNTGAAALCKALMGPFNSGPSGFYAFSVTTAYAPGDIVDNSGVYVAVADNPASPNSTPPPDPRYWAPFNPVDGADGPGFRTVVGASKVWGPYLDPGTAKVRGSALIDASGNPILYFPARPNVNVRDTIYQRYVFVASSPAGAPRYNVLDNVAPFRRPSEGSNTTAQQRIQLMLGDYNLDGKLSSGVTPPEEEVDTAYVLWAPGPDGQFGPLEVDLSQPNENARAASECDDVLSNQAN